MSEKSPFSRSGSAMALLLVFAYLAGLAPGLPLGLWVGGAFAHWPGGELTLAEPGGGMIIELVRTSLRELAVAIKVAPVWFSAAVVLSVVPQGALAAQLASPEPTPLLDAVSLSVRRAPSLLAVAGAHLFARVVLVGLVIFFAVASTVVAKSRSGELVVIGSVAALGALLACALRLVADIAIVRVMRAGRRAGPALLDALGASSWRAFAQALLAALLGVVTFGLAAFFAHRVGAATGAQAFVGALLRLLALASLVVTRALCLGVAAATRA